MTGLPEWVRQGVSFRDESGPKSTHIVWHVRALVDDRCVMRRWSTKWGGSWQYAIEGAAYFAANAANHRLLETKKPPALGSAEG